MSLSSTRGALNVQSVEDLSSIALAMECASGSLNAISDSVWKSLFANKFLEVYLKIENAKIPDLERGQRLYRGFNPWYTLYTQMLSLSENQILCDLFMALMESIMWKSLYDPQHWDRTFIDDKEIFKELLGYDLLIVTFAGILPSFFYVIARCNSPLVHEVVINNVDFRHSVGQMLDVPASTNYAKRYMNWPNCRQGVLVRFFKNSISDLEAFTELSKHKWIRSQTWNRLLVTICHGGYYGALALLLRLEIADPSAYKSRSLRVAIMKGHIEIVELLLEDGRANVFDISTSVLDASNFEMRKRYGALSRLIPSVQLDFRLLRQLLINQTYISRSVFLLGLTRYIQASPDKEGINMLLSGILRNNDCEALKIILDKHSARNEIAGMISHDTSSEIIKTLLRDSRFDPDGCIDVIMEIINREPLKSSKELTRVLLDNPRIDASQFISKACFVRECLLEMAKTDKAKVLSYLKEISEGLT